MSDSTNVTVVRSFYDNLSAPEVLMQILSPTIRWEIVSGFPHGGVYLGVESVFQDFFGRVLQDFENWRTVATELHDAGDHVVALGTYSGRARATGKAFSANFTHVWTLEHGIMTRLQQCADTAQLARALES